MIHQFFDLAGLILALLGAVILAFGLIIPRRKAIKIGVSRMSEDSDDKNIHLPYVRYRIRESQFALIGLVFLIIGFLLQIIGSWMMV